jgi:hypothetical protein
MNIKHLREATGLGLKQSKDIVDELFKSSSKIGIEVHIKDNFTDDDWDAFGEWFEYEQSDGTVPKGKLQLFEVIFRENGDTFESVVLSTSKQRAMVSASEEVTSLYHRHLGDGTVTTCEEVTSFKNGQVLLMRRS